MAWKCVVSFLGVALLGCTSPNPKSCADGFCNDPALPFCDVDGAIAGVPEVCVAVDCTPGEFVACRGDEAIACNADGSNYDVTTCQLGCEATTGCKLCEPNQTACTNGTLATCDANGNIASSEKCGLGCLDDQPRCRDIDPSNGLAQYIDLVEAPADIELDGASIDTATGSISSAGGPIMLTSYLASNGDGPSIRVFVGNNIRLKDVSIDGSINSSPAIAFLARGSIVVEGRVRVGRAGAIKDFECLGWNGRIADVEIQEIGRSTGSGGGGNATPGGNGGSIGNPPVPGGMGGGTFGNDAIIPLRGGCAGGSSSEQGGQSAGIPGGGAIQLSSAARIEVRGIIDVRGTTGWAEPCGYGGCSYGGGAGGGILLEAGVVELGPDAKLIAKGGGGGAFGPSPQQDDTANPQPGISCGTNCSGGNGAAVGIPAGSGTGVAQASTTSMSVTATAAGGGGLGRARINTLDTTYIKANTTIEAASLTAGLLRTR